MFFTILFFVFIQVLITYPKRCFGFMGSMVGLCIPLTRKYLPRVANYLEMFVNYVNKKTENSGSASKSSRPPSIYSLPERRFKPVNMDNLDTCSMEGFRNIGGMSSMLSGLSNKTKPKEKTFEDYLSEYEEENNTKVVFIHHKVQSYFNIFNTSESLSIEDAKKFVDILSKCDDDQHISLVIDTPGGSLSAAEVIIHAIKNHKGGVSAFIPYRCMSAGTLIALVCDEVYLAKNAYCGTIDPQMYGVSVTDIIGYCKDYADRQSFIGDIAKFGLKQAQASVDRIKGVLSSVFNKDSDKDILEGVYDELLSGKHNHDKPLFYEDIDTVMVFMKSGVSDDLMAIFNKFTAIEKPKTGLAQYF